MEGQGGGWQLAYLDYKHQFHSTQGLKAYHQLVPLENVADFALAFQSPRLSGVQADIPENILDATDMLQGWKDTLQPPIAKWP
jgi:hypothetical protein